MVLWISDNLDELYFACSQVIPGERDLSFGTITVLFK